MQMWILMVVVLLVLAGTMPAGAAPVYERTSHPDAQWFPQAGFGLFMHWGIHSVAGVQPSWAMIKDYPYGGELYPPERYYALANQFNPQNYDPDKWMAAAVKAGFTYAVLGTKHCDGYALWPSSFGDMGTRQYMNGRDLLKPYVEACRKHGLKVGFYFSPVDWHYPGFPIGDVDFDYNKRGKFHKVDPVENQINFEKFYAYDIGQLGELLTRYGKIDVLWFDGMAWEGVEDIRTPQTLDWVRQLQPGIVIDNRWGGVGDFETPECSLPEGRPTGWWEACDIWNGHWGYNPGRPFRPNSWVLETLVKCRSWGGNFLLNCGPAPDGTMPEGFYERCDELTQWMAHSRESLIGAGPTIGDDRANVLITTRGTTWYLHVLPKHKGLVEVHSESDPKAVRLLRTGEAIPVRRVGQNIVIELPEALRTPLDDVVVVDWGA